MRLHTPNAAGLCCGDALLGDARQDLFHQDERNMWLHLAQKQLIILWWTSWHISLRMKIVSWLKLFPHDGTHVIYTILKHIITYIYIHIQNISYIIYSKPSVLNSVDGCWWRKPIAKHHSDKCNPMFSYKKQRPQPGELGWTAKRLPSCICIDKSWNKQPANWWDIDFLGVHQVGMCQI